MPANAHITRRQFLAAGSAMAAGIASPSALLQAAPPPGSAKPRLKIAAFEKPLQSLGFEALADFLAELGFDGVATTVRKGGHVPPERVEEDLPRMAAALRKRNLEITELTTDITRVDQPDAEKVLRTAARLGVKLYRLGSLRYDLKQPILPQLDAFRAQFKDLAALNKGLGLAGVYQIHSGASNVGAPVWDIHSLVKDYDVSVLGIAFDVRHAAVEGGTCWPINFHLVRPHIGIVYAKDFEWQGKKAQNVPLGQGMVDPKFYQMLRQTNYTGPICLHVEYPLPEELPGIAAAFRRDLAALKAWL